MSTTTKYAAGTTVSKVRSREEIENTLKRFGATAFMYGEDEERAMIAFQMRGRHMRMTITYPKFASFTMTRGNVRRTPVQMREAREQEIRRLWRSLAMIIKAKLEAVESGVETIEQAFMPHVIMANNQTVGEWLTPQIESMYQSGHMPPLLPAPRADRVYEVKGELVE